MPSQTLLPSIDRAKNAIDKALAERDGNIDKFCSCLDKDIADLNKEVKEVKQEAQNPMILDANAEKSKVKKELDKLQTRMQDLQKRAFTYKSYQKNFKVRKMLVEVITSLITSLIILMYFQTFFDRM